MFIFPLPNWRKLLFFTLIIKSKKWPSLSLRISKIRDMPRFLLLYRHFLNCAKIAQNAQKQPRSIKDMLRGCLTSARWNAAPLNFR